MFIYKDDLGVISHVDKECDMSDSKTIDTLCGYLKKGHKVHLASIIKKDITAEIPYTFTGKITDQIGKGVVLSGFRPNTDNYLVDIS